MLLRIANAAGSRVSNVSDDPLRTLRLCDSALKAQHSDGIPVFAHFVVNHPRRKCRGGAAHLKCKCKIGEDLRGCINPHLKCKCKIGEDLSLTLHAQFCYNPNHEKASQKYWVLWARRGARPARRPVGQAGCLACDVSWPAQDRQVDAHRGIRT